MSSSNAPAAYADHYGGGLPPRSSLKPKRRARKISSSDSVPSSTSSSGSSQFQMMQISISILVLEGLVMECNISKDQLKVHLSDSIDSIAPLAVVGAVPVTAVISCFKNISGNRAIATHVPSLPLGIPKESLGKKNHQFMVRWPVDYDPSGDALSTFRCNRLMKREYPTQTQDDRFDTFAYGYDAEEIELNICLLRGSEMITLGAANLVVTGEETREITIDLPIDVTKAAAKRDRRARSPSPLRRTGSKIFGSAKPSTKVMKAKPFPKDSRRKYKLGEHSMVRLRVKVNPTRPSSSFDEFGPDENLYHSSSHQHPNVPEMRSIIKPVQSSRPDIPHTNNRSRSGQRLAVSQPIFKRNVHSQSPSATQTRNSVYNDEPAPGNIPLRKSSPNYRYVASKNSRQEMRRGHSVGETYSTRRERRENGHNPQEYQRQEYHARSRNTPAEQKFALPTPDKRHNFHKRMVLRNEMSSQNVDHAPTSLFQTLLSKSASFINSQTSDDGKYIRRSQSSNSTYDRKRYDSSHSSSSSRSEYDSESDGSSSSYESSRRGRGRSPPRRKASNVHSKSR